MLEAALQRSSESDDVEFKSSFDTTKPGDWLEIIKDLVAMANSGGGVILIGVLDSGEPTDTELAGVLSIDPADLTNKIYKYTNAQFGAYEILPCQKSGRELCAIVVKAADVPIVFVKVGTYEPEPGRQKTAFGQGTVYFRHGPKSEPCTSDDLRRFVERRVEALRASWLDGIAKVVEAPAGSRFAVLPPATVEAGPAGALPLRLTDDASAPAYYAVPIDRTHPFRQKEAIQEVNRRLAGSRQITAHDILCIRRVHRIHREVLFCYTQNFASPRYSVAFVDWIVRQYEQDEEFFLKAKTEFDRQKQQNVS